jgi:hypothetical protein
MIWVDLGVFRFFTDANGASRDYRLEVLDWGLQVKEVIWVLEVVGRSSTTAQIGLKHEDAPQAVVALARSQGTPIALGAVTGNLPKSIVGTATGTLLPHFWGVVTCDTTLTAEEFVEARVWAGGKPF